MVVWRERDSKVEGSSPIPSGIFLHLHVFTNLKNFFYRVFKAHGQKIKKTCSLEFSLVSGTYLTLENGEYHLVASPCEIFIENI